MLKAFADNDSTKCGTDSYSVSNNLKECLGMQSSIRFDFLYRSPIEDALVSAVFGALSALEALCDNVMLYKLTLTNKPECQKNM